jgi:hypothetical protein
MCRSVGVLLLVLLDPISASQALETFRVSKAALADVQQETLQVVDTASNQVTEVFPGPLVSPLGEAVMTRIETLRGRVDEADRAALIAGKASAGFDRSITHWATDRAGRRVALAVRYYRDLLWRLELEMTDDYGRADPVDPARYEFIAIAVCSRSDARVWTCREEQLADVASRYQVNPPQDRAERLAVAEKLVEMVAAGK